MNVRKYIALLLLGIFSLVGWAQNTLSIPQMTGGQGKTVAIPISMSNEEEVVAVQFNLHLPFAKPSNVAPSLTSNRNTNGHTVSIRSLGSNRYTVVIVNMNNRPLAGSGGVLLNFPMSVPTGLEPESVHDIRITDVVISDSRGENIATGSTDGSYTIQRAASPDLEVSDVKLTQSVLTPGQSVDVSWKVSNVGDANTGGGWTEKVYLVSTESEERVYLGSAAFSNILTKGGHVVRNVAFKIPEAAGLEGDVTARVVLEPNSNAGEYQADRANNTADGGNARLQAQLFLTVPTQKLVEGQSMRLTLKRSGDRTMEETYSLSAVLSPSGDASAVVQLPATVTIPAGQSAASFTLSVPQNETVNSYADVTVSAISQGSGLSTSTQFTIEDDELLPLTVKLDKSEYNEGETIRMTVSVPYRIGSDDLTIFFNAERQKRFALPQSYTFEPGATTAVIEIPIVQDNTPANVETIELTVSAERHAPASALLILNDDDVPAITMTLTPEAISEAQGANAIFGTITRSDVTNSKITIKLTDDSKGQLYYSGTITMPAGTTSVTFPIGVKDNQKVDGDRVVRLTASIYITDCGCDAIGNKQSSFTVPITITDNDGPALSLSTSRTTILEGNAEGAVLTISRNNDTTLPLTVSLSCQASDVTFPATVTIPAGQESVTASFVAERNAIQEGNRTVTIQATADQYSMGTAWLLISDQTLPDVLVSDVVLSASEYRVGEEIRLSVALQNQGAAIVPQGMAVDVSLNDRLAAHLTTVRSIEVGGTDSVYIKLPAQEVPGEYKVQVSANPQHRFTELQYLNNAAQCTAKVRATNFFELSADKDNYHIGETIVLSGTVKDAMGAMVADAEVEVYLIYAGKRTPLTARSDAQGHFGVSYEIPQGMAGAYTYGACYKGENLMTGSSLNVYGFTRSSNEYIKHSLYVDEPYAGKIELKNLGNVAIHNIRCTATDETGNYTALMPTLAEIPASGTASAGYVISSKEKSSGNNWDIITLHFTSDEGAELDVPFYNYTYTRKATLVAQASSITTTVNKSKSRIYPFVITNTGLAETGKISVVMPEGLKDLVTLATPAEMPSMATGDSAAIMLRFDGSKYDVNLIQKGSFAINCENGNGISIPFNVKVVSEEKGNLRVFVQDESTIYGNADGEHPYVSGATVRLTDYNTGAIVVSDVTDKDGQLLLNDIDEGAYQIYVTAPKHDSYRQNLIVSPGETTTHQAYLSYQAINVSWNVVETEVEDVYDITTSLTYETQVPVPVVIVEKPDTIPLDLLAPGESMLINVVMWNKGLIAANDVYFKLQEVEGFTYTPLAATSDITLAAGASHTIPIIIANNRGKDASGGINTGVPGGGGSTGGEDGDDGDNPQGTHPDNDPDNPNTPGGNPSGNPNTPSGGGGTTPGGTGSGPGGNSGGPAGGDDGDGGGNDGGGDIPCEISSNHGWSWPCGPDSKYAWLADVCQARFDRSSCGGRGGGSGVSGSMSGGGGGVGRPGLKDPTGGLGASGNGVNLDYLMALLCTVLECLPINLSPPDCVKNRIKTGSWVAMECVSDAAEMLVDAAVDKATGGVAGTLDNLDKCEREAVYQQTKYENSHRAPRKVDASGTKSGDMPDLVRSYFVKSQPMMNYYRALLKKFCEWTGAPEATDKCDLDFIASVAAIDETLEEMYENGTLMDINPDEDIPVNYAELFRQDYMARGVKQKISAGHVYKHAALAGMMPQGMARFYDFDLRDYVRRWQNDARMSKGEQPIDDNYTHREVLDSLSLVMDSCQMRLVQLGFANWADLCISANKDKNEYFEKASKNTCATVKLEINQKLVLTRQAFRGTLTVENTTSTPLTDIQLKVAATDLLGKVATSHEMQINTESITGFTGSLDGPWTLAGGQTGVATILFIPTKYAAPDTLTTYSFGGTLRFNDGNETQMRNLYPVSLQVKPSPELDLTYFMQRDVMGDNPLTAEVEPMIPAEFTVLIHNKGKGDANNVKMLTQQPRIVTSDSDKGLQAQFTIVGSSVNGSEQALALDSTIATGIGTIAAGSSSYASWYLTCDLMGHFTDYDVRYTHVTDYGNPDLSLLDRVTIHELIHSVNARVGGVQYRAWVTNDYEDGHSDPDHIYLSNGTDEDVVTLRDITEVEKLEGNRYRITVIVPQKQWFYTSVANPGGANSRILYLTDEDSGKEVDPENFWTSDYTMQDGIDPLLDYRLHLVDLADGPCTRHYIVEFEPKPDQFLAVQSVTPVTNADAIITEPITEFTVTFNKDIDHTTFTRSDLLVRRDGVILDDEIPILRKDGSSQRVFLLDTRALNDNGYYTMQVRTDSIRDLEGFLGSEGRQFAWMLYRDGMVQYSISVDGEGGTVETSTGKDKGDIAYGSVLKLTARPNEGHAFRYWMIQNGSDGDFTVYGQERQIELDMLGIRVLKAVFQPVKYQVNVTCDQEQGRLSATSGVLDYGTEVELDAIAAEGYALEGYLVNGVMIAAVEGQSCTIKVTGSTDIVVVFKDLKPQNILLSETADYQYVQSSSALSSVSLYRSFRKGSWNTICLPCMVDDPVQVFGVGTKVARLTGLTGNVARFKLVDHMEAHVPYLIQPGRLNSANYVDGSMQQLYSLGLTELKDIADDPADNYEGISFIGTYNQRSIDAGDGNYYLSEDKFYYVDDDSDVMTSRYRGYFHLDGFCASKVYLGFEGATSITLPLEMILNESGVYDAGGVMVRKAGESMKGLKPGLYITHDKKVLVK